VQAADSAGEGGDVVGVVVRKHWRRRVDEKLQNEEGSVNKEDKRVRYGTATRSLVVGKLRSSGWTGVDSCETFS
jgi:hypothetical protein